MPLRFTNRTSELDALNEAAREGGLVVVFGRRRVGKTRLMTEWLGRVGGFYSQAIEAAADIQIEQVARDVAGALPANIAPKSWIEFFELLSLRKERTVLCLDEFPYLTATDASLPSVIQRWLDHRRPEGFTLVLSGSSTSAMNACFLNRSAPLYQRARKVLAVRPMDYAAFCGACRLPRGEIESFIRFALVGGIPKYWEFVRSGATALDLAEELFFGDMALLEDEPARILKDERVAGLVPLSVLEAVGRGAGKTSEIAARLGTAQTNLGRVLQQLLDAAVLAREIPFGESLRSTKRILYKISDPAIRFWFRVYSPNRTAWRRFSKAEKTKLLRDHAAGVFEDWCRARHDGAARLWDAGAEFDSVRRVESGVRVGEVKFQRLSEAAKCGLHESLQRRWEDSSFSKKYRRAEFEVFDASELEG
jgi:uncharacterized protein